MQRGISRHSPNQNILISDCCFFYRTIKNHKILMLFFFKFLFELFYLVFNMGRTVPSFRPALEHEIESWKNFKRALRPEDQKIFNKLMNYARIHADAGSMSARPMLSEILFISFAVEQEKRIELLEEKVKKLEELIRGKD